MKTIAFESGLSDHCMIGTVRKLAAETIRTTANWRQVWSQRSLHDWDSAKTE